MRLFVITLERFPDRHKFVADGLTRLGVEHELFLGIDEVGDDEEAISKYDEAACLRHFGAPLNPGEIGCFSSHYALWKKCVEGGEPITIIEDDVQFLPGFPRALALVGERIEQHRFIRLTGCFERAFRVIENISEQHKLVRLLRGPCGTQCYSLSPEGAAVLLAGADQWIQPVDHYVDSFWIHGVESKALLPFEAYEPEEKRRQSSIGDRTHERRGIAKLRRELNRNKDAACRLAYNLIHR